MIYKSSQLSVLLVLAVVWQSAAGQDGVILTLRGVQYPNNSVINIVDIGENQEALICQTNRRPCCHMGPNRAGEWYYPDGSLLTIEGSGRDLYRNRGDEGEVRLNRRNNALYPIGLYRCEVPDASNTFRSVHVTLLNDSYYAIGGSIVDLFHDANSSQLTCVTVDGLATFLYGECINEHCQNSTYINPKITIDPEKTTHNNILNLNKANNSSYYVCITRNNTVIYFATLLTEFGKNGRARSSQLVGRLGEQVTLLCLADVQVRSAAWTVDSNASITFPHLNSSNAGVYTCRGRTLNNQVVSHSVNLAVSGCSANVFIVRRAPTVYIGRDYTLICDTINWERGCNVSSYFIYHKNDLKSNRSTILFEPLKLSDAGYYVCTVTTGGFNFTSNPTFISMFVQLPSPDVHISSSLDNPIPTGSFPTLTCTITLDPSIDTDVKISVSWNGPVYGLGKFTATEPFLNSSAEVPTYISTAMLNADGTFYDSGQYSCSAVVSPLFNQDLIQNASATSESISVTFLSPHRPNLNRISQVGHSWIYLSWNQNPARDNVSNYEVKYSYIGECVGIARNINTRTLTGTNRSYNITGLSGEYFNYSINLTAINDAGRSPPNIAFARTKPADRNSEISNYIIHYSLVHANGSEVDQRDVTVLGVRDEDRTYTIARLQPQSTYTVTIAAVNVNDEGGPTATISVTTVTPESVPFQIHLIGVHSCLQWRISNPEDKIYDVSDGIVRGINHHCLHCEMTIDDITQGEFQCFPGTPNQVTFRGKVQDRGQATAREVIYYIEQWITSSDIATIPVHHARLRINSTCVVLIASLDDPECPGYLQPTQPVERTTSPMATSISTSTSTSSVTHDTLVTTDRNPITGTDNLNQTPFITNQSRTQIYNIDAVVGGVVAIVFIITTGFVIVLLLYIILKYRQDTNTSAANVLQNTEKDSGEATTVKAKDGEGYELENYTYVEIERRRSRHLTKEPSQQHLRTTESEAQSQPHDVVADKIDDECHYMNFDNK